jgi:phage portal protein BeeE
MGILDRFKKREINIDSFDPLLKATISNQKLDRQDALEIPAVSSCVELICNTFAMIPFKLYQESNVNGKKETKEVDDNRVKLINDDTTDVLDGFQFKKAICEDYLLGKGGYAYIKRNRNQFIGLFYVENNYISILKNANPIFKSFDISVNGKSYKNYEFIKLLRNTKDGASGIGLIDEINRALRTAFKRICYEYDLTITGGSRKGFIKSSRHLGATEMEKLKKAWEDYYSGTANTVILNDGMEFQEASNNSNENQLNEKNITFNGEMKDLFHISDNYDKFIKNAIMPIATAFCTALNRDFLLETEKKSFYFAPDTKELYKGSLKERYEAYQIAIKNGFKTRNEIRFLEDDDAIEGLDMISLGLGDVLLNAETGQIYTPNTNQLIKMGDHAEKGGVEDEN